MPSQWGLTPEPPAGDVQEAPAAVAGGQTPVQTPPAAAELRGLTPEDLPADGTAAHEKLGQEAVQRLRQRYAEVRARIGERITDPARRDELTVSAERINPDAWKTADEVASALEQYESVLASLREVAGRKRRRRKRGGGRRPDTGAPAAATPADADSAVEPGKADDDNGGDDDDTGSGES